jgi:hypothetical protein
MRGKAKDYRNKGKGMTRMTRVDTRRPSRG